MKYIIFSALSLFLLISCQTDKAKQQEFAGQYQVTLHLPEAKNEMEKAKQDVEKELKKAKEEIKTEIQKAKEEIEAELGENSHSGNAASNFVEGIGELAQGLAGLGEGLGKMGIDIGQGIVDGLKFKAEFKPDGTVYFGKKSRIQIGAGNQWEIKDGKFYLWEEGEEKKEFTMKKLGDGKWDLISSDLIFHLEKITTE
jgi:hypothetical protein